jgi:hypothetical protein
MFVLLALRNQAFVAQFMHSLSPDASNVDAHEFTPKRVEQRRAEHQRSYSERSIQIDVSARERRRTFLQNFCFEQA